MGSTTNLGSTTGRPNSPFGNLTLTLGFCIVVAATSLRVQYSSRSCVPRAGLKIRHGLYLNRPVRGRMRPAFGPDGEEEKREACNGMQVKYVKKSCPFFGKSGCPGTSSRDSLEDRATAPTDCCRSQSCAGGPGYAAFTGRFSLREGPALSGWMGWIDS
jgi:hypothetical protein